MTSETAPVPADEAAAVRTLLPVATPREAARRAWRAFDGHRGPLVVAAVMFALSGFTGLVAPFALGLVVDALVEDASGVARLVWWSAGAIALAAVVETLASAASVTFLARAAEPALAGLREQVLENALGLDHDVVEAAGEGDLLSRVGDDVRVLAESVTTVVPMLIRSVVAIAFTAAGFFVLDWRLGLAGLATLPFYALGLRWYLPRSGPYYRAERVANGERAQALLTAVHGHATLRAQRLGERHAARVAAASWRSASLTLRVWNLLTRFGQRTNRSELIGLLLVLGTGFFLVRGDLGAPVTVGAVTTAALFFHRLFNPIGIILMIFDEVQSAGASMTRVAGVAGMTPATAPQTEARGDASPCGRLSLSGVGHRYAAGRPALADVTITVEPGQRVAVVGASGAGKSTLGQVVAGRIRPTDGEVLLDGRPVGDVVRAARDGASPVVVVTQEVHVFSGSVRDNLTLADATADDARLWAALERLGAAGWVRALAPADTDPLDLGVGDGGTPLTPAQAQHLALVRVELADPLVVVLDEATAEAGSAGARALERAATTVTTGRTTLTIAHRLTQAEVADRVLVLEDGEVVEDGPPQELARRGGHYARLSAAWHA
ncbi:ABC transporter ATP-binding protein [Nocardioides zeae]|uniref:ABC transporter ATP-binding protein n=1 Tax=Nocardioides imazamoxiresistens TaxID=3231893 RepID=A0ABU3PVY9_9ACTN|nr:ABC transporter ATP-binding protein [Nocardioides zeae]MDT9593402.1 ABC transporter ATP-binding protein [Nocardioides zeae]